MTSHMRFLFWIVLGAVIAAAPALADPGVSEPTVNVTLQTPSSQPTPYPATVAQWSVAVPGHDATLTAHIPGIPLETDVTATWTSDLLRVSETGPVVTIDVSHTSLQGDPSEDGDPLTFKARFSRADGDWSAWKTMTTSQLGMGAARGSPAGQGSARFTIPYIGSVPAVDVRVQLEIIEQVTRVGAMDSTFHVTA